MGLRVTVANGLTGGEVATSQTINPIKICMHENQTMACILPNNDIADATWGRSYHSFLALKLLMQLTGCRHLVTIDNNLSVSLLERLKNAPIEF